MDIKQDAALVCADAELDVITLPFALALLFSISDVENVDAAGLDPNGKEQILNLITHLKNWLEKLNL